MKINTIAYLSDTIMMEIQDMRQSGGTMTSKAFKGETRGSDKRFAFHRSGVKQDVAVYESPIDMMSG